MKRPTSGLTLVVALISLCQLKCVDNESPTDMPAAPRLDDFLSEHNRIRGELGLDPLAWSEEIAQYSLEWADELARRGCPLEHRPDSGAFQQKYGENLAWNKGYQSSGDVVTRLWESEKADYDYATGVCTAVCGHYTQVVWRTSQELGCARSTCGTDEEVWVCNYNPPGNYVGEKPY